MNYMAFTTSHLRKFCVNDFITDSHVTTRMIIIAREREGGREGKGGRRGRRERERGREEGERERGRREGRRGRREGAGRERKGDIKYKLHKPY